MGSSRNDAWWMAIAVVLSGSGMAVHTVTEFGAGGLVALETGMIPVVAVQATLFILWWRLPTFRSGFAFALFLTAVVQFIGGAIISVLPLPFLPFEPAQNIRHYLAHAILGATQVPLLAVPLIQRSRTNRPARGL